MSAETQLIGSERHLGTLRECGTGIQLKARRWLMESSSDPEGDIECKHIRFPEREVPVHPEATR